ncbi:MAG TPA: M23 family metallopeptidase [Candidatus Dormibacteraeota bacterium]|nr:M23 family metallopeptidase [Candidatus Dormibacteraeota bacterium]
MNRLRIIFWFVLLIAVGAVLGWSYGVRGKAEAQFADEVSLAREEAARIQRDVVMYTDEIAPPRISFNRALEQLGLDPATASRVAAEAQHSFDFRHFRAGNKITIGRGVLGDLREIHYRIDTDRELLITPQPTENSQTAGPAQSSPATSHAPLNAPAASSDSFHAEIRKIPSETETAGVTGTIHGSLFESVIEAGERPELAMRLAEIFGWDLDFYTDTRPNDTFRIVVEKKKFSNGEIAAYGRILAAEYNNAGHPYRAVLFHDLNGHPAYFTPDGKAMKKAFLHSPLKFAAAITSHYSANRFHPILKEYRPHLGIDYAAPTGTPVQTIGEGRVTFAGRKGGAGNLIEIQHTNGYTTYYMHLSRVLVRTGQHVEQGQRIGLVGMTGLATGPHLDFRIQQHGQFLNFERLGLPTADPISKRDWTEFASLRDAAMTHMPDLPPRADTPVVAKNTKPRRSRGAD